MTHATDIKKFREARNWSQERLASELGVNQATISRLESGASERRPYILRALERLADLHPAAAEAPDTQESSS